MLPWVGKGADDFNRGMLHYLLPRHGKREALVGDFGLAAFLHANELQQYCFSTSELVP